MNSVDWKAFLTETVTIFREEFERLGSETRKSLGDHGLLEDLPIRPCQIEVFDFGKRRIVYWLLVHDERLPDLTFEIHKDAKSFENSGFLKKYKFATQPFMPNGMGKVLFILGRHSETHTSLETTPHEVAMLLLRFVLPSRFRNEQVSVIERSAEWLKESIAKIPEKGIRDELLTTTGRIDDALREIKRVDEEIGKVRQLVGLTKEVQDWKLLISDVDRLKEEHVSREVFESEMKRLDQRIDALKEIKFWSKRTAIDIVLAVIATVSTTIATLLAAGFLKF